MEIRFPRILPLLLVAAAVVALALFLFPRLSALARSRPDPEVEVAIRAAEQIYAARPGETFDALAPELAARYRQQAERLPEWQRGAQVEIYGAALVWKGEGFSEVAVAGQMKPLKPDAARLPIRIFVRIKNGKAVAVFPTIP